MIAASLHLRLLVQNYAACFRFYTETLGLDCTFGDAESGYADLQCGSTSLALFDASEMAAALGTTAPRSGDAVAVVLGVVNVWEAWTELTEAGVPPAAPPTNHPEWGIRTAHVRDPDGNLVELNQPLPHE